MRKERNCRADGRSAPPGCRKAIARDHVQTRLEPGVAADELRALNEARRQQALEKFGKTGADVASSGKLVEWKLHIAAIPRRETGARHAWVACESKMGSVNSVRSCLSRRSGEMNTKHRLTALFASPLFASYELIEKHETLRTARSCVFCVGASGKGLRCASSRGGCYNVIIRGDCRRELL